MVSQLGKTGHKTSKTAAEEKSWVKILINVPTEFSKEVAKPTEGPYSLSNIPMRVGQFSPRKGLIYTKAKSRQEIPPPKVNHQALKP